MGPDIVVLDSIVAWCLALTSTRLALVGMLHQPPGGIDFGPVRTSLQARLDRLAYRRLRRVLAASESLADDLRAVGVPAARMQVVPPGRDVAANLGPPEELRRGRHVAFLSVGNWVERKGILSLLEAFAALEPGAATLHLVGNTTAEPKYAQRVWARLGRADLRSRVVVHGPVSTARVAAMYAAYDAFVVPGLKEPYGTVYGEAMAFGLPVAGWRAGNLPDLASHEREGLVVEPGDIVGLSAALRRLAQDDALRARLGAAAKQRALARPTWAGVAKLCFDQLRVAAGWSVWAAYAASDSQALTVSMSTPVFRRAGAMASNRWRATTSAVGLGSASRGS